MKRHADITIDSLGSLWRYELKIREWRKDYQIILQFTYSHLPICFAGCVNRGWLKRSDFAKLSERRRAQIDAILSKRF